MRILFLTAFYPPHVIGGWEQLVHDINVRLQARGHATHVLTSTHGLNGNGTQQTESGISRVLELESDLIAYRPGRSILGYRSRRQHNLARTREVITTFRPDVVFIHVMWNLSRTIAWLAEQLLPGRVVYYIANDWPYAPSVHAEYWGEPAERFGRTLLKRIVAPLAAETVARAERTTRLQFQHVLCVSEYIRRDLAQNAGIPLHNMSVVYNGVETDRFVPTDNASDGSLSLLYAGSLVPHKGVHTAIEAMEHLVRTGRGAGVTLALVGSGHPAYEARLRRMVNDADLESFVHFHGRVPREQMPDVLAGHDALIFPSIWEEPLARMMQEAMAAGLVVIGTTTGGSGELLVDGETGLTFAAEDAYGLARQIERLDADPTLRRRLAQQGRKRVVRDFDLRRMIDEIDTYVRRVARQAPGEAYL